MLRRLFALLILLLTTLSSVGAVTAGSADPRYGRVEVAPTRTSIYVGVVSMTMPPFVRSGESYTADYDAKVFPYFFYNEHGRLTVDLPNAKLDQLARGETVEFTGHAVRADGETRHVEGKATPKDASTGTLKVRVFVSKRVQLIFNTTYRFSGEAGKTE